MRTIDAGVDEAKDVGLFLLSCTNVGDDMCAGKAFDRLAGRRVALAGGTAVRQREQVVRRNLHALADRLAALLLFHQLRDAVEQDVLVVDGREPLDARGDLEPVAVVLVDALDTVRLFRQRVERVLELRHQILERSVCHIADEQVPTLVPDGHELAVGIWGNQCPPSRHLRGFGDRVKRRSWHFRICNLRAGKGLRAFVLHAFQRKSKRGVATPQPDVELIKRRLKQAVGINKGKE